MKISILLSSLLKGKILATVAISIAIIGGATAAAAATPAGQSIVHTMMGQNSSTTTSQSQSDHAKTASQGHSQAAKTQSHSSTCPGLPEAQQLATRYGLSTASTSDDIQALCALHQGTFKGTTPQGTSVSSSRVFGYGEINALLAEAQKLAAHDAANASSKLSSDNVRSYLAAALKSCGTSSVMSCLAPTPSASHPNNGGNNGSGNGGGKPASTPTPPPHH